MMKDDLKDKCQLIRIASDIEGFALPQLRGKFGKKIVNNVSNMLEKIPWYIREKIQEKLMCERENDRTVKSRCKGK